MAGVRVALGVGVGVGSLLEPEHEATDNAAVTTTAATTDLP